MKKIRKLSAKQQLANSRNMAKGRVMGFTLKTVQLTSEELAIAIRVKKILNELIVNWDANTKKLIDSQPNENNSTPV